MEIEGGYIWSPKTNRGGGPNQTYLNLTNAQVNDRVFSYAGGEIKAVGVVTHKHIENPKPPEFGQTGNQWADEGWLVEIEWQKLERPLRPKDYINEIAPLLPQKHSPIRTTGNGNQSCYLAAISERLGLLLLDLLRRDNLEVPDRIAESSVALEDNSIETKIREGNLSKTEKEQLIKARLGQGVFRLRLEGIESRCRLTGVSDKRLLVASHIKPWRYSSNPERLDGYNGLLLSPHVDKLFDRGWISFSDQGKILCAKQDIKKVMLRWNLNPEMDVGSFKSEQRAYLAYHRQMYRFE
jgi:hypothetical protein